MSISVTAIALAVLLPAMTGTTPVARPAGTGAVMLALCHGGAVAIGFQGQGELPQGMTPCCAKGCRSGRKSGRKAA